MLPRWTVPLVCACLSGALAASLTGEASRKQHAQSFSSQDVPARAQGCEEEVHSVHQCIAKRLQLFSHFLQSRTELLCRDIGGTQQCQEILQPPVLGAEYLLAPEDESYELFLEDDSAAYETIWDINTLANTTYHTGYHPLHEIEEFMEDLAITYPDIVQLDYIGHSGEGREMLAIRLSKPTSNITSEDGNAFNVKKSGFVITGAQHAREVRAINPPSTFPCPVAHATPIVVDCDFHRSLPYSFPCRRLR